MRWIKVASGLFIVYNALLIPLAILATYAGAMADTDASAHARSVTWGIIVICWFVVNLLSAAFSHIIIACFANIFNALATLIGVFYLWHVFKGRDIVEDSITAGLLLSVSILYFFLRKKSSARERHMKL